ncbi:excinuclease ATPase subunit [Stenotrophomonas sp.]|uniref:excinuclease ATPase subunit n=1 Tax=Stenotrophomonas sp. TaxID=69392 RepID=UPI0028A93543|nr:excinuclease ATPase subunit [Stenotrophomonas sp.]
MRRFALMAAVALFAFASTAQARDTPVHQSLQELVDSQTARDAGIDGSVKFYLAGQKVNVLQRLGEDVTNKKTNAANKSDEEACRWVALSALKALQDGAKSRGANAVVDIVSYYKKNEFKSTTDYECYAGAILAGVALKGTYAKVGASAKPAAEPKRRAR